MIYIVFTAHLRRNIFLIEREIGILINVMKNIEKECIEKVKKDLPNMYDEANKKFLKLVSEHNDVVGYWKYDSISTFITKLGKEIDYPFDTSKINLSVLNIIPGLNDLLDRIR